MGPQDQRGGGLSPFSLPPWLRYWMGPLRLKICPCRPVMDSPKHVNCLFTFNSDSERLHYYSSNDKWDPRIEEGGGEFNLSHPLAVPLESALC